MKKYDNPLFWSLHPSLYISMWVGYDYMNLSTEEFLLKYINEMDNRNEETRMYLGEIINDVYKNLTGSNYDTNHFAAFGLTALK